MNRYDLFISYSSKDKVFVHKLANDLKQRGLNIWLDSWEMLPGDRLRDRINEAINKSNFILVVLTPNSINSSWVQVELDSAMIRELEKKQVVVIPILFGDIKSSDMPSDLKGKLYLNFNSSSDYDDNIELILKRFSICDRVPSYEFELLLSKNVIELLDTKGERTLYTKRTVLKVLAEKMVFNYSEYYSDGTIDSFEVKSGSITSINRTLGKLEVINDFGRELLEGETFDQEINCIYHNSFLGDKEYWQIWNAYPTQKSITTILFPIERPPMRYKCKVKVGTREIDCKSQPEFGFLNGKPSITVEIDNPEVNSFYKVEWEW